MSASDARGIVAARGRDGAARNADVAALRLVSVNTSAADARSIGAALCIDGAARDGDVATRGRKSASDARIAAFGCDGAARNADVAALMTTSAADARAIALARYRDFASLNAYVAAGVVVAAADDCRARGLRMVGDELARASYGKRRALRPGLDAGIEATL